MGAEGIPTEQEKSERVRMMLERAIALHKENSEKGEVYLVAKDMLADKEWATQTYVSEISDGYVISPDGQKMPLQDIDEVIMVDEA